MDPYRKAIDVLMSVDVDFRDLGIKLAMQFPDIFMKLAKPKEIHEPPSGYPPTSLDTGWAPAVDSFEEDGTDRQWCQKAAEAIKAGDPEQAASIIQANVWMNYSDARYIVDALDLRSRLQEKSTSIYLRPAQEEIRNRIRKFL